MTDVTVTVPGHPLGSDLAWIYAFYAFYAWLIYFPQSGGSGGWLAFPSGSTFAHEKNLTLF
jgi:hypothetical protein